MTKKADLEQELWVQFAAAGLPLPERQYRFVREVVGNKPGLRKRIKRAGLKDWRFDFAWRKQRVFCEVQGGTWARGRHTRGSGYRNDCEKLNAAARLGWTPVWVTTDMVSDGSALAAVERALQGKR